MHFIDVQGTLIVNPSVNSLCLFKWIITLSFIRVVNLYSLKQGTPTVKITVIKWFVTEMTIEILSMALVVLVLVCLSIGSLKCQLHMILVPISNSWATKMDTQNSSFYKVNQTVQFPSSALYCIWLPAITELRATCPLNWHHASLESLQQSSQAKLVECH